MKRLHLLSIALLLPLCLLSLAGEKAWLPKSAGPPACFSGEPPRETTCHNSGCHTDFPLNTGTAHLEMKLGGAENGYTLGQIYRVRVALSKPSMTRGGFQAIALQDNNDTISPGTFTLTDLLRTQRIDRNLPHADTGCTIFGRVWIEHTEYGIDDPIQDTIRWEFDWQAPATDVGSITFYAAAVEANADLDPSGDHVYSISQTISPLATPATPPHHRPRLRFFPQPASDLLSIDFDGLTPHPADHLSLYDLTGQLLLHLPLRASIDLGNLPSGIYLIKVAFGAKTWVEKIVKD